MTVAVVTDVSKQKIFNWTTYPGIVAGLVLNLFGQGRLGEGWEGLQGSLMGFAVCGFIMLVSLVFFQIGGGDVKLIAMMGAFLGLRPGVEAMLWTFILAAIFASCSLIWQIGVINILTGAFRHLIIVLRAKSWVSLTDEERAPLKAMLFLAPSGFVAVCIVEREVFKSLF